MLLKPSTCRRLLLRQGIIDAEKKREKATVQERADGVIKGIQDEADAMEFDTPQAKAAWMQQQARNVVSIVLTIMVLVNLLLILLMSKESFTT